MLDLSFLICQELMVMVLHWIVFICPSRFILPPSPSFHVLRRLTYMGYINGLTCPVVSKWVCPMRFVIRKLEKGKRVRLGNLFP